MNTLRLALLAVLLPLTTHAGWLDWLPKPPSNAVAAVSQDEIALGLKQAIGNGVQLAVKELGREDGFLKNANVKIPMPTQLLRVERVLRTLKQDKLADEFVTTLNRAAEKAVPEAAAVFGEAVKQMTVTDARMILTGSNDAATAYFRRVSEPQLREKFRPIVSEATQKAGVTSAYKTLLAKAGPAASFLGTDATDLDGYVTREALNGLFTMIAAEEKRIRENPAARTTELLKKVFGAVKP